MPGHYNNANSVGYSDIIAKLVFSSVMDKKQGKHSGYSIIC